MRRKAWHCKACGKRSFDSEGVALSVVEQISNRRDRPGGPRRAYECPKGNGWHLTSQKQRSKI